MKTQTGNYHLWDLVAQGAYLPTNSYLLNNTLDRFEKLEAGKNVWLFGFNDASKSIIDQLRTEWNIVGILDNSSSIWGTKYKELTVYSPNSLIPSLREEKDVIILSLRLSADAAYQQVRDIGFTNIYSLGVLVSDIEPYHSFILELNHLYNSPLNSNVIMIESMNDFDGNAGALYEYLKSNDDIHHFIWVCKSLDSSSAFLDENDRKIIPRESIDELKEYMRCRATAKWEIWECDPIRKVRADQINVFLQHYGMGYKQVAHLYKSPEYVDYVLTTNELVYEFEKKSITYSPQSKVIFSELPRNDVLIRTDWDELSKVNKKQFAQTVIWTPTLRESRYYQRVDSDISYPFGISLIYTEAMMNDLNKYLNELNMFLIIKIHPRQKINFREIEYSNIAYLDGNTVKKIHSYKLLTQMDAMITDYSSMIFDYMLLDRPCAWVLEDRDHYKIDYLMDDPMEYMPGAKVYTFDDLLLFLKSVSDGEDTYRDDRRRICAKCNPPFEGKGCEKLVEVLGL